MPRLSLSEGKFAGLLLVAYEKGVEDMKLAVRVNPFGLDYELKEIGDKVSTFHVNEKVREEQHHIFHSWVEEQLRELARLNRAQAGEALLTGKKKSMLSLHAGGRRTR